MNSVRSEDNASAASRNFSLENMSAKQRAMVKRCWDEMQAQIRGWRLGAPLDCPELNGIDGRAGCGIDKPHGSMGNHRVRFF